MTRLTILSPIEAAQEQVSEVLTGLSAVISAATLYIAIALVF